LVTCVIFLYCNNIKAALLLRVIQGYPKNEKENNSNCYWAAVLPDDAELLPQQHTVPCICRCGYL
ncbi:MAG: hypothetical protein KBI11_08040, partial [Bacteroidales bacterium]|nr:hypothetical protein [Bacteroidales bacterium]